MLSASEAFQYLFKSQLHSQVCCSIWSVRHKKIPHKKRKLYFDTGIKAQYIAAEVSADSTDAD